MCAHKTNDAGHAGIGIALRADWMLQEGLLSSIVHTQLPKRVWRKSQCQSDLSDIGNYPTMHSTSLFRPQKVTRERLIALGQGNKYSRNMHEQKLCSGNTPNLNRIEKSKLKTGLVKLIAPTNRVGGKGYKDWILGGVQEAIALSKQTGVITNFIGTDQQLLISSSFMRSTYN